MDDGVWGGGGVQRAGRTFGGVGRTPAACPEAAVQNYSKVHQVCLEAQRGGGANVDGFPPCTALCHLGAVRVSLPATRTLGSGLALPPPPAMLPLRWVSQWKALDVGEVVGAPTQGSAHPSALVIVTATSNADRRLEGQWGRQ